MIPQKPLDNSARATGEAGTHSNGHPGRMAVSSDARGLSLCNALAHTDLPAGAARLSTRFTPWFPGPGLIDGEGATREFLAVQPLNGGLGCSGVRHLDKAKAFGPTRITVRNDTDLVDRAIRRKDLPQIVFRGGICQITYKDIHRVCPLGQGGNDRQIICTRGRQRRPEPDAGETAKSAYELHDLSCGLIEMMSRFYQRSTGGTRKKGTGICILGQ
jgi:hypothetical protein